MNRVCFEKPTFNMYMFILICIISYLTYFVFGKEIKIVFGAKKDIDDMDKDILYKTIIQMKDQLLRVTSKLNERKLQTSSQIHTQQLTNNNDNNNINNNINNNNVQLQMLDKIYNPLVSPDPIYASGRNQGFDGYIQYQMLGYLSGQIGEQFPVFGRYKYPGKLDKYEYYTINEGRGRIKIPFKTINFNELEDGDKILIPELGNLTFTKYEIENTRYNPNI